MLAPAKLNLFLAVTGRRPDGFHNLVSVAAPLSWGDDLELLAATRPEMTLECDDPTVPSGPSNLVLKAAAAYQTAVPGTAPGHFRLTKRIPHGAGLGGGSSDGAIALKLLNERQPQGARLSGTRLAELAASVGSDCPLFLQGAPCLMRGRGEILNSLSPSAAKRIEGRRVVVFKPEFGISTPWAYGWLAARAPAHYLPGDEAEARLAAWLDDDAQPLEQLLFNQFEAPAFSKFPALPVLAESLRRQHALEMRLTGSGSACFALLPTSDGPDPAAVEATVRSAWGPSAFFLATNLSAGQIPI